MSKPWIHAKSSARKFGGVADDYMDIHQLMDSSKSVVADNRHRVLTHNSWFLFILERIFGVTRTNSGGREYSVRDVGEQHIMEDYGNRFIPTPQDYIEHMAYQPWMGNDHSSAPSSYKKVVKSRKERGED